MTGNWLYNKSSHQTIMHFVTQCKPPWSIRGQHKKSAWSFKTWTFEIRVEYAVDDSRFWLSKWYLCWLRGHEADVFPVHSSIGFLWFLSLTDLEFDFWNILENSLTSFEVKSFLLPLNDRLMKNLVSQVWSNWVTFNK